MFDSIMPDDFVTPTGVQRSIDAIARHPNTHNNHDIEDELYERILRAIATGKCSDPVACAALALETKQFTFPRYTA
jgi:hypothetical protein